MNVSRFNNAVERFSSLRFYLFPVAGGGLVVGGRTSRTVVVPIDELGVGFDRIDAVPPKINDWKQSSLFCFPLSKIKYLIRVDNEPF